MQDRWEDMVPVLIADFAVVVEVFASVSTTTNSFAVLLMTMMMEINVQLIVSHRN